MKKQKSKKADNTSDLSEISKLSKTEFQSRLHEIIKRAKKDKKFLQTLKDKPIEALNQANMQIDPQVSLKIISSRREYESANCDSYVVYIPENSRLNIVDLRNVAGGGWDWTILGSDFIHNSVGAKWWPPKKK